MTKTKMKRELQLIWEVMHSRFKMIETIEGQGATPGLKIAQSLAPFIDPKFKMIIRPWPESQVCALVIFDRKANLTEEDVDAYTDVDTAMFELTQKKPDMMYVYGVLHSNNIITKEDVPEEFREELGL